MFCFMKFLLSGYLLLVLLSQDSKTLFLFNFNDSDVRNYLLMKLVVDNLMIIMLFIWTGFTSLALFLFGISLIGRYG